MPKVSGGSQVLSRFGGEDCRLVQARDAGPRRAVAIEEVEQAVGTFEAGGTDLVPLASKLTTGNIVVRS